MSQDTARVELSSVTIKSPVPFSVEKPKEVLLMGPQVSNKTAKSVTVAEDLTPVLNPILSSFLEPDITIRPEVVFANKEPILPLSPRPKVSFKKCLQPYPNLNSYDNKLKRLLDQYGYFSIIGVKELKPLHPLGTKDRTDYDCSNNSPNTFKP